RPTGPARALAAHVFQRDAIDRAHGDAQFATRAVRLDHGVHALVGARDRVGGAGLDAQRATDAPVLVDDGHGDRAFDAVPAAQRQGGATGDGREAGDAFGATGRALVDAGLAFGHGLRVAGAVRVAAALALRLRQGVVDAAGEFVHALLARAFAAGRAGALAAERAGALA